MPRFKERLHGATSDVEILYSLWLFLCMPLEFRLPVAWAERDEHEYRRLVKLLSLVSDVTSPLPPFMNALAQLQPWIREKFDLSTQEGIAFFSEWVCKEYLNQAPVLPCVESEFISWANEEECDKPGITRLMMLIWGRRPDLQAAYDLASSPGRGCFRQWFCDHAGEEYAFDARVIPANCSKSAGPLGSILSVAKKLIKPERPAKQLSSTKSVGVVGSFGGEFGVGQHARSVVESLDTTELSFDMLNVRLGPHDHSNTRYADRFVDHSNAPVNLLCLNVMSALESVRAIGAKNILGRYNILYGYWELASCPASWSLYLDLFDEFWAPTKFIAESLQSSTSRRVIHMPISVTMESESGMSRAQLGLPDDRYLFLFHFDGHSYPRRKNAEATIKAFKHAFKDRAARVTLIIKSKHLPSNTVEAIHDLIDGDERIMLLQGDFPRNQIIGLEQACDAYVSLHRSEGFGMGPAEMMCLGKPVIVTGYSGNLDFTNESNSCLINYRLVPVEVGDYAYYEPGQVWAEPDIEQAAHFMRKLFDDRRFGATLGEAAKFFMKTHHNPVVIGKRYMSRIAELNLNR